MFHSDLSLNLCGSILTHCENESMSSLEQSLVSQQQFTSQAPSVRSHTQKWPYWNSVSLKAGGGEDGGVGLGGRLVLLVVGLIVVDVVEAS